MKVETPRIIEGGEWAGDVLCEDCPYSDKNGWFESKHQGKGIVCGENCPTAATYAEACRLAEEANGV